MQASPIFALRRSRQMRRLPMIRRSPRSRAHSGSACASSTLSTRRQSGAGDVGRTATSFACRARTRRQSPPHRVAPCRRPSWLACSSVLATMICSCHGIGLTLSYLSRTGRPSCRHCRRDGHWKGNTASTAASRGQCMVAGCVRRQYAPTQRAWPRSMPPRRHQRMPRRARGISTLCPLHSVPRSRRGVPPRCAANASCAAPRST
mmetsp:Transcript_32750/g.86070  ORF Transcript_32750/g.86070 Transcript_32750/m.86070 type:complete len:205 (+) Transcript_32750:588-1202(+)